MKTSEPELKTKATILRKLGLSYGEIKREVNVSKSTLSLWLKNVPLTDKQKNRLYTKQISILERGPQSQKERRTREVVKIISDAEKEIKVPIADEAYKLFGVALYWAEGDKAKRFAITNSDPALILFIVKWLNKVLKVSPRELSASLNLYPQQNENDIKNFWSRLTGIPLKNFEKSFIKPANKNYKKNNLYYGTIKIRVRKGTDFRYKVFGWAKKVVDEYVGERVDFVQKQWNSLKETNRPINLDL